MSETYLQTYIKRKYFISTIYRESSAFVAVPPWYYETFVWPLDDKGERGDYIDETDSMKDEFKHHFEVVKKYLKEVKKDSVRVMTLADHKMYKKLDEDIPGMYEAVSGKKKDSVTVSERCPDCDVQMVLDANMGTPICPRCGE